MAPKSVSFDDRNLCQKWWLNSNSVTPVCDANDSCDSHDYSDSSDYCCDVRDPRSRKKEKRQRSSKDVKRHGKDKCNN